MKLSPHSLSFLCAGLVLALPTSHTRSQMAPVVDPVAEIQAMQTANDDLLKRQEATLKELTDMTTTANEIRIFSKRG